MRQRASPGYPSPLRARTLRGFFGKATPAHVFFVRRCFFQQQAHAPADGGEQRAGGHPGGGGHAGPGAAQTHVAAQISVGHPPGLLEHLLSRDALPEGVFLHDKDRLFKQARVGGFYHDHLSGHAFDHSRHILS